MRFKIPPLVRRPDEGRATIQNRVADIMAHIPLYSIEGQCRFAADIGFSRSSVFRLVHGNSSPSHRMARAVTDALSKRLGVPLDMREIFTTDGTYPTACVCDLTPDCKGCFPDAAYDRNCNLRAAYRGMRPGDWCRYPESAPAPEPIYQ